MKSIDFFHRYDKMTLVVLFDRKKRLSQLKFKEEECLE